MDGYLCPPTVVFGIFASLALDDFRGYLWEPA